MTLAILGNERIKEETSRLMLGTTFIERSGLIALSVLRAFKSGMFGSTDISLCNRFKGNQVLPADHNQEVETVPAVPKVRAGVNDEPHGDDLEEGFGCKEGHEEEVEAVEESVSSGLVIDVLIVVQSETDRISKDDSHNEVLEDPRMEVTS